MNTRRGKIYLRDSVLDDGDRDYIGGNMKEFNCSEIYIYRDGISFKYKGYEYYVPHSNVRLIRLEEDKDK